MRRIDSRPSRHDIMRDPLRMNSGLAQETEELLYSTLRQQRKRSSPVNLPFIPFWERIAKLLDAVETEVRELYHSVGPGMRMNNAIQRQTNLRRAVAELARRRSIALAADASNVGMEGDGTERTSSLDWSKHDPIERKYHLSVTSALQSFKQDIEWSEIFSGSEGAGTQSSRPPPSTLEEFVDRSPGKGPPPLEALERAIPSFEEDEDDEARIARLEGFPELAGPLPSSEPVTTTPNPSPTHEEPMSTQDEGVGIAPELATAHEAPSSDHIEGGVRRIRVIVDLEDAVMTEGGPVPMNRGDVHALPVVTASYLVDTGVAEFADV